MENVIIDIYYTGNNFCAEAPILPGCVSTAVTLAEMKKNIKEAIAFHVESSIENNDSGMRKPRPAQRKRIEEGLHRLGTELLAIGV